MIVLDDVKLEMITLEKVEFVEFKLIVCKLLIVLLFKRLLLFVKLTIVEFKNCPFWLYKLVLVQFDIYILAAVQLDKIDALIDELRIVVFEAVKLEI